MRRLLARLRTLLGGPSDEALRLDLAIIRRRLDRLEADARTGHQRFSGPDDPNVVRFVPARRRGLEG